MSWIFKFGLGLLVLLMAQEQSLAQKLAYKIYSAKGKAVTYEKMLAAVEKTDVVCFGELHNNPIAHWLQLELLRDAFNQGLSLQVGAEMFEADTQPIIDAYFMSKIDVKTFTDTCRLWPNYHTDYKPILEFARQTGIPLIATNVPRKYARTVAYDGPAALEKLSAGDKKWIAPLPYPIDYELPSYKKMIEMAGGHNSPMKPNNFVAAQAIKDATMAHFILANYKQGAHFLHLNGAYHSDYKEGIIWYLKKSRPNLKVMNISTVEQASLKSLADEHLNKADFIIVVPETMTKTYE